MMDFALPFQWRWALGALDVIVALGSSAHVVLNKRDSRSAIGWVGLIWLAPFVGALTYFVLGINRIQRRARKLRQLHPRHTPAPSPHPPDAFVQISEPEGSHLDTLARLVGNVTDRLLLPGNRVEPLVNGEQAYPAMLEAIRAAKQSVALSTYIFDNDLAGERFVEALRRAVPRGVEVRVLIDDVGSRYTWPSILGRLRRAGVPVARFLPTRWPWAFPYANLRNHRKILVVDGRIGFTGGINIRAGHDITLRSGHPVQDLHFRIEGPAVSQLQEVFADDWEFCTSETLQGEHWFPALRPQGRSLVRGITSGPDDDFEKLRTIYLGALACARTSVRILTPYFLPDAALVSALNVAALRGVQVDIMLPRENNLRLVQWASTAQMWQVLGHGCRVWFTPPPFDHTKLVLVDNTWALVGSANWDPRSLRLNFEFNLECYDPTLATELERLVRQKLERAQPVTLADMDGRHLLVRLRDGLARLFTPYL